MNIDKITIEVGAKLAVDKQTAECCLKLVELYHNQNNVEIVVTKQEDGTIKFHFEERNVKRCEEE